MAVGLMRMALALLDREGETMGAARLQHAIDTTLKEQPLAPGEEIDPEQACLIAGIPLSPGPDRSNVTRLDRAAGNSRS